MRDFAGSLTSLAVESRSKVQDLRIWHAAQELIDRHPHEPELAACRLADEAWEAGDMVRFRHLMCVAKAVQELVRTKPHVRKAIN
jgi:hypothetical protein